MFFQEKNLGALANGSFVIDKAFEEYDSVIFTGDDNIFAPAFLDYMNKMLRVYEKNPRIWIVSGFSSVRHHYRTPVYLSAECRDWGMGVWKEKWRQMASCDQIKLYEDYAKKTGKVFSLYLHNKRMFCVFVHHLINRQADEWLYDSTITSLVYMLEGYAVYPAYSLVMSKGWDGSGERCAGEFISEISSIELRNDALFAFDDSLKRIPICKRFPYPYMEWTIRDSRFMKAPLSYILYRIMGRERFLQWRERRK